MILARTNKEKVSVDHSGITKVLTKGVEVMVKIYLITVIIMTMMTILKMR